MAESSTCFVRSFSTPAETTTCEGNPLRALGESISFGRYMSESLDWEKWSIFSHNRYVEEAEKYSKPGSVAAKKAYFEAHYKRKAAEKADALVEEANGTFDSETWEGKCTDSSIKSEADNIEITNEEISKDIVDYQVVDCDDTNKLKCDVGQNDLEIMSEVDNIETINEEIYKDIVDYQVVDCDDANQCTSDVGQNDLEIKSEANNIETVDEEIYIDIVDYQVVDCDDTNQFKCDVEQNDLDISVVEDGEEVIHPCNDMNLNVESCTHVDNSNQINDVEVDKNIVIPVEVYKNIVIPVEEMAPDPDITSQEVLALPVKGRELISSPKSSAKTRADSCDERKASATVPPRIGINSGLKCKNSIGDAVEKKILTARSLRMSINLPSGTGERNFTSKATNAALRSRNGTNRFTTSKNTVGSIVEKERLTASSLHMSIDVPSGTSVASKTTTTAVKPRSGMNIVPKSTKSIGALMEKRLTTRSLHMSINLSSGAGETCKNTSVIEHNRNKKIHSDLPEVRPVSSRTSTQTSHGLLSQAPANLPSQGRSCPKSSSTIKSNPRSPTKSSPFRFRSEERAIKRKELLQRMDKTKSKEEEKVQLQRISKNSVTLPRSPRLVRKASSSTIKNLGNSWKPPTSTNNSKCITEKNNQTRQSGTSSSNTTRENASPNIQH